MRNSIARVGIENFPVSGGFDLVERERGLTRSAEKSYLEVSPLV